MVWQAASQTRFRALKYENGIAGKPSIIVRFIACYRPLLDCQVSTKHLMVLLIVNCLRGAINWQFQERMFVKELTSYILSVRVHGFIFAQCLVTIIIHSLFLYFFQAEYFRHLLKPVTQFDSTFSLQYQAGFCSFSFSLLFLKEAEINCTLQIKA